MIIFDQLRIADDGKALYVDIHVNKSAYFDSVYLDSITIATADKVWESSFCVPASDFIYQYTVMDEEKEIHLRIDKGVLDEAFNNTDSSGQVKDMTIPIAAIPFNKSNFSDDLFFVFVKVKGTPDACVPCCMAKEVTVGATFDSNLLYQRVLGYTRELAQDCTIPQGFTDFILLWNAFKAAVETEHFVPAYKYYNMLFGKDMEGEPYGPYGSGVTVHHGKKGGCGCHG